MLSSCLLAEFDIWYNESFFIPEDMQVSLKPGSSIRPGMVPVSRLVSLVSGTRATVGTVDENRVGGSTLCPLFSPQTCQCMGCSQPLPQLAQANGRVQVSPQLWRMGTQRTSLAAATFLGWLILLQGIWRIPDAPHKPCQGRSYRWQAEGTAELSHP